MTSFVTVCAATSLVKVADVAYNIDQIKKTLISSTKAGAKVIVFPELCVTGYTCRDLFLSSTLLTAAKKGVAELIEMSRDIDAIFVVGAPLAYSSNLYNCAFVICKGKCLGAVPKSYIPNYFEFTEATYFSEAPESPLLVSDYFKEGECFYLSTNQIFRCSENSDLCFGVEICEDMWVPQSPSDSLCRAGATMILNLSASNESAGKTEQRRNLVAHTSAKLHCAYVYTSAGWGESTSDIVFGGHNMIYENGDKLAETLPFKKGNSLAQVNFAALVHERRVTSTYKNAQDGIQITFNLELENEPLTRSFDPLPFVSSVDSSAAEEILDIQAYGLAQRLSFVGAQKIVLGVSGGLDSTLALLVAKRAFDVLGLDASNILAISMPGFGTSDRTHNNARDLCEQLGASYQEIPIVDAVSQHFADIGHDPEVRNVVYENAQARERTQILMDIANAQNTFVLGTGDLSELALGWATYNGDHMSMYGVNASIPKTLVRHLVRHVAETASNSDLSTILLDICATPVSPELLPTDEAGEIAQKTEDKVGPYILHDFIIYHVLAKRAEPAEVFEMAKRAFDGSQDDLYFSPDEILKWLKVFYRRFFSQQYKRSCMPDGPKATCVSVSPRGNLQMPSDASAALWLSEIENLSV